jgi:hypothetical protein
MVLYQTATKVGVGSTLALSFASKAATADMVIAKAAAFGAAGGFKALAVGAGAAAAAVGALMVAHDQWNKLMAETGGWEGFKAGIGGLLNEGSFFKGVDDFMNEKARNAALEPAQPATALQPEMSELNKQLDALQIPGFDMAMLEQRLGALGGELGTKPGSDQPAGAKSPQGEPQMVTPQERVARTISEQKTEHKEQVEINIRAPAGVADVKQPKAGSKTKVKVTPTGYFSDPAPTGKYF